MATVSSTSAISTPSRRTRSGFIRADAMKSPRTSSLIRGRRAAGSSWSKAAFWVVVATFLTLIRVVPGANAQQPAPLTPAAGAEAGRFMIVDVMVETGQQPLAAYQIEVAGTN